MTTTRRGLVRRISLTIASVGAALALTLGFVPNTTPPASAASNCYTYGAWSSTTEVRYNLSQRWCISYYAFLQSTTELTWQSDGNLVSYIGGRAEWASNTSGRGAYLKFQTDGNVVIYNSHDSALWSTKSSQANYGGYSYRMEFPSASAGNRVDLKKSYRGGNQTVYKTLCIVNSGC